MPPINILSQGKKNVQSALSSNKRQVVNVGDQSVIQIAIYMYKSPVTRMTRMTGGFDMHCGSQPAGSGPQSAPPRASQAPNTLTRAGPASNQQPLTHMALPDGPPSGPASWTPPVHNFVDQTSSTSYLIKGEYSN